MRKQVGIFGKQWRWISLMGIVVLLSGCSAFGVGKPKQGALQVTSNGAFGVYLDETFLGQTPYFDEEIGVGEYVLRLVPSDDETQGIWQAQIQVAQRALTVVHYEWSGDMDTSSSEVLELVPLNDKDAVELSLSTVPDSVVVKLDGELKGFSPIVFDEIGEGDHVISLEAPGYRPKTINLKTNKGHRLRIEAQMARDPALMLQDEPSVNEPVSTESAEVIQSEEENQEEPADDRPPSPSPKTSPSPSPSTSPTPTSGFGSVVGGITQGETSASKLKKPYVEVLETGTGWLRVREDPSGFADNEVAKIKVGNYFPFVERSEGNEWVSLEYDEGKEGWVSGKYVKVIE